MRKRHALIPIGLLVLLTMVLPAIGSVISSPVTHTYSSLQATPSSAFDPTGNYVFAGRPPRAFAGVKWIALETTEINPKDFTRRAVAPRGSLWAGRELKMIEITLDGDALSFTTAAARGVSYKFEGRFLERGIYVDKFENDSESKKPVLKGTLTKLQNGKTLAETEVSLKWVLGD